MTAHVQRPEFCLKYLAPGRLVRIVEDERTAGSAKEVSGEGARSGGGVDWGWGIVIGFSKRGAGVEANVEEGEEGEVLEKAHTEDEVHDASNPAAFIVNVLLPAAAGAAGKDGEAGMGLGSGGGRKRKADCGNVELDQKEEEDMIRRLVPYDWDCCLSQGLGKSGQVDDRKEDNGVEQEEERKWIPVVLPMLLTCVQNISTVKIPLGNLLDKEGGGGGVCDLRSKAAQTRLLQIAMRAVAFFQGGDCDGGFLKSSSREREWQRALPMVDPMAGEREEGRRELVTVCHQLKEVDARVRKSVWQVN